MDFWASSCFCDQLLTMAGCCGGPVFDWMDLWMTIFVIYVSLPEFAIDDLDICSYCLLATGPTFARYSFPIEPLLPPAELPLGGLELYLTFPLLYVKKVISRGSSASRTSSALAAICVLLLLRLSALRSTFGLLTLLLRLLFFECFSVW